MPAPLMPPSMHGASFDVGAFISRQRIGRAQILVLLLCLMIMLVDGYDVFIMGFILAPVAHSFGVTLGAVTPVFIAQAAGLALGSYLVSPLADRLGRRTMLLASVLLFGLITLATTQAGSVGQLIALRFAAGVFFSSMVPNAIALTTEIAPHDRRATLVTLMFCGYTGGAGLGGAVAALLVQSGGWPAAFWVGGLAPLVMLPVLAIMLPESLRFRVLRNPRDARIPGLLRRIQPDLVLRGDEVFTLNEPPSPGMPVLALFRDGRAARTSLLWMAYFANLAVITLLGGFLPTLLRNFGGLSFGAAAGVTSYYSLCGIIGMLLTGRIMDVFGISRVMTLLYLLGFVAIVALGVVPLAGWPLYVAIFGVGVGVVAAQGGLNALGATLYPTHIRATGVGWAFGAGRVGSVVAPLLGGMILSGHWTAFPAFLAIAVPMLFAAAGTYFVGFSGTAADIVSAPEEAAGPVLG